MEVLRSSTSNYYRFNRYRPLVNVPIGILVVLLALKVLPTVHNSLSIPLDVGGALSVTVGLMLLMYAITQANATGFLAPQTLAMFGVSVVLLVTFLVIQTRSRAPLMPLRLFRQRNFSTANVVMICWSTSIYGWFFLCSLYLHGVLHYSPTQIGFGYLPCPVLISTFGLGLSAKVIARFGTRLPIVVGMALCAIAYALFARAGADAQYARDILPTMVLTGLGSGLMFSPTLLSAMNDMGPDESGLASGLVNTSMMMGGAVGVAILASIASFRFSHLLAAGASALEATNGGYHLTSFVAAALCVVGALLGALLLRHDATAPAVATVPITH